MNQISEIETFLVENFNQTKSLSKTGKDLIKNFGSNSKNLGFKLKEKLEKLNFKNIEREEILKKFEKLKSHCAANPKDHSSNRSLIRLGQKLKRFQK